MAVILRNTKAVNYLGMRGFSLVELVMVIVLLGIIAVSSTQFIRQSVGIYSDSVRRDGLQQQGRFAVERISRELRNALPGSVRVFSSGSVQCLEFVPIVTASSYLSSVAGLTLASLDVVDFNYSFSSGHRLAIYPIDNTSVYGSPNNLAVLTAVTAGPIANTQTLSFTSKAFTDDSPTLRIYIVANAISFCVADGVLTRHQNYGSSTIPISNGVLLAESIRASGLTVFEFTAGILQRSGVLHMNLQFVDSRATDELVRFSQEVFVRNTP